MSDEILREAALWREHCDIIREGVTIEIAYKRDGKIVQTRRVLTLHELDNSRFRNSYAVELAAKYMMDAADAEMRRVTMPNV